MCMQDVDIGRALKTNTYTTAGSLDIPANPNRLAIRLCAETGDTAKLYAFITPTAGSTVPLLFMVGLACGQDNSTPNPGTLPDDITIDKIGDLLKGPLVLNSAGIRAFAIETYLDVNSGASLDVTKLP